MGQSERSNIKTRPQPNESETINSFAENVQILKISDVVNVQKQIYRS